MQAAHAERAFGARKINDPSVMGSSRMRGRFAGLIAMDKEKDDAANNTTTLRGTSAHHILVTNRHRTKANLPAESNAGHD